MDALAEIPADGVDDSQCPAPAFDRAAITISGNSRPADHDGDPGLPPGSYEVVVVQIVLTEDLAKEAHTHGNTVPRRYADYYTSDLKVDVTSEQTEPIEIVLQTR